MSDIRNNFDDEDDSFTTVLSEGYTDYHDTVVDEAGSFDPALFAQASSTASASHAQSNTQQRDTLRMNDDDFATRTLGAPPLGAQSYQRDRSASVRQTGQAGSRQSGQTTSGYASGSYQNNWQQTQSYSANTSWQQGSTLQGRKAGWRSSHLEPAMMAATDKPKDKSNTGLIVALVVLSVIAIVALVVVFALALASHDSPQTTKGTSPAVAPSVATSSSSGSYKDNDTANVGTPLDDGQSKSSSSSEPSSSTTNRNNGNVSPGFVGRGNGRAVTESEFYEALSGYYKDAADYDKSVASCATDFNNNYLKEDESIRKSKANAAKSLKQRIKSAWDNVKGLTLPLISKNLDAHNEICELYECLWHRIDVIDRAWQISLKYDKPEKHKDEIQAPIKEDQVNGENKYYTRFNELYSNVKLVKP